MAKGNKIIVQRLRDNGKVTLSKLFIYDEQVVVFECVAIEPTWLFNLKNVSAIPQGAYEVVRHTSPSFGDCLLVKDVPERSSILFHAGNYYKDTKGCILPGYGFLDLNNDGVLDVTQSKITLSNLMDHLDYDSGIELVVVNHQHFQSIYGGK